MNLTPLRILVVLPLYGGSLPIGKYCARALRNLGHHVRVYDNTIFYSTFSALKTLDMSQAKTSSLENAFLRVVSQGVFDMAKEQESQLVLALAQAPLNTLVLRKFKTEGIPTVMWFVEDYNIFEYWRYLAPLYSAFATIQKEPFLTELKKIGQKHAFYLPLAALPDFHKPLELSDKERKFYGSDISFLGAGYPNRRIAFRKLADRDFKIWGTDWDGEIYLQKNLQKNSERINEEESVKIYNASKININLHSSLNPNDLAGKGDFVNPRTFEAGAAGAFQLVSDRALLRELFAKDEIASFSTVEEMLALIDEYLASPEKRELLARKTRERILKDHTYEKRMEKLVAYMCENFKISSNIKTVPVPDVPSEFLEKISALAISLGLGPNPSFEEIVSCLRRQQTPLTDLETAILFLDEWEKLNRRN